MNDPIQSESDDFDSDPIVAQVADTPVPPKGFLDKVRQYDNYWGILLVNFGVTGVLGLPLIWYSKKFSSTQKIIWSIIVSIYTLILIGIVVAVCIWVYRVITIR